MIVFGLRKLSLGFAALALTAIAAAPLPAARQITRPPGGGGRC